MGFNYIENLNDTLNIILSLVSCFFRAFLDTIEKHLFEFDYLNPFKVTMIEGIIDSFLLIIYYLIQPDKSNKFNIPFENDRNKNILLITLLILYFIFSGLKNIYRIITIKLYSPMTRALTESITDPIIISTNIIKNFLKSDTNNNIRKKINNFWYFYMINVFFSIIMAFCSCIYNDFIVLYCCGLEHDTHLEITKRSLDIDKDFYLINDEEDSFSDEEEGAELTNKNVAKK